MGIAFVVGLAVPLILSSRRSGFRGAYFAAAFIALILGYGCNAMTGNSPAALAAMDATTRRGVDAINEIAPTALSLYSGLFIGSIIGGLIFRTPMVAQPSDALRACPHCAEPIQVAAKVCRFCQRDVPAMTEPTVRLSPLPKN